MTTDIDEFNGALMRAMAAGMRGDSEELIRIRREHVRSMYFESLAELTLLRALRDALPRCHQPDCGPATVRGYRTHQDNFPTLACDWHRNGLVGCCALPHATALRALKGGA